MKYIVRGGVFTNTDFADLVSTEERYGPFESYSQAFEEWSAKARQQIDICCHRLFIELTE